MTNARAEALLDKQGIEYEREPSWIEKGQKPDFYCHRASRIFGAKSKRSNDCQTRKNCKRPLRN